MSFSGHPVFCLGLNWCILLGLFIFPALAKGSCYLLFLWETNKVNNAFKCQIPYVFIKNQYVCLYEIMGKLFGGHYMVFFVILSTKMYLFAITAYCLSFPDKNLWFSSQRRREGVVGDANSSISKIMHCTCFLCSSQISQLLFT